MPAAGESPKLDYAGAEPARPGRKLTVIFAACHLLALATAYSLWEQQTHEHMLHANLKRTAIEWCVSAATFALAFPIVDLFAWGCGRNWIPLSELQEVNVVIAAIVVLMNSLVWGVSLSFLSRRLRRRNG